MLFLTFLAWFGVAVFSGESERSDLLRDQGEKLYDQEKYEESLVYYQKAFAEVEKKDPVRAANLCNDISSVYYALHQFDKSIEKCRKGISILAGSSQKPDSLYFKLYSSLGTMFHNKAMGDSSTYYFLLSDKLLKENAHLEDEIPEYVLHHYLNQGRSVWRKHRFYDSIEYFENALALSRKRKMSSELSYIYASLAEVYDLLKQHKEALGWRFKALEELPAGKLQSRQSLYGGMGHTYRLLQNPDSALVWFNKSLATLSLINSGNERSQVQYFYLLIELGDLHMQKGNLALAQKMFRDAETFYHKHSLSKPALYSQLMLSKGDFERHSGYLKVAMSYYERSFRSVLSDTSGAGNAANVKYPKYAINALKAQADLYEQRYRKKSELADLEKSYSLYTDLIAIKKEGYKQAASSSDDRYFLASDAAPVMDDAIMNGFEYYTRTKSGEALDVLFNRFEDANTTYLMDIIPGGPDSYDRQLSGQQLKLKGIRQLMDDNSVFISYKLVDSQMMAFVVSGADAQVVKWEIDERKFSADLKSLLLEVKVNPGLGAYAGSEYAQKCYEVLLKPLEKWTNRYSRWIVVRDWKFSSLPFEVLERKGGEYLADVHRIAYTYSASFFWFHPVLTKKLPNRKDAFVFAPFIREKQSAYAIEGWKPVSTAEEVRALGQHYLLGKNATKRSFIEESEKHYIVNLATHAFADLKNPNSSYVQFYPGVDSKLYLEDVIKLRMEQTRLVMLSSCFGNEGTELAGEGTISLAYAFAQAGCPSLITTTWEANENTISFLTVSITKYIEKGLSLDEAVQKARRDLRTNGKYGKYDHPYFWANVSLLGNHSPVYREENILIRNWYLVASLLLLGAGFLVWKRKYQMVYCF